jgi:hypothetical protein
MPSDTSLVPVFVAIVRDGKLRFGTLSTEDADSFLLDASQTDRFRKVLEASEDLVVEITIRPRPRRRTQQQSRYERGALKMIGDHLGWDKDQQDQLHRDLLKECFGTTIDSETGDEIPLVESSRDLSTDAFREFLEWIPRIALERYEVDVPMPNEMDYQPTVLPEAGYDHGYARR